MRPSCFEIAGVPSSYTARKREESWLFQVQDSGRKSRWLRVVSPDETIAVENADATPFDRYNPALCNQADSFIYVSGGRNTTTDAIVASAQRYDIAR